MIDKDAIAILREKRTRSISIVFMNCKFPLSKEQQHGLDKLSHLSDVFLVFDDSWNFDWPETSSACVDKIKFACLHDCFGCVDVKRYSSDTILKVLEYTFTIPEASNFLFYTLVFCKDLDKFTDETQSNWKEYKKSNQLSEPVCKMHRLPPKDLQDLYKIPLKKEPSTFCKYFQLFWGRVVSDSVKIDYTNAHCTHLIDSWFIPVKLLTISKIVQFARDSKNSQYIKSFQILDPRYFLASLLVKLGVTVVNRDICEVSIKADKITDK